MIYAIIFFISLCFAISEPDAARLYLWSDNKGRMHIAEGPPTKGSSVPDVIEYEFRTIPQAAGSSDTAETKNRDKKAKCRNVFEVRRDLRKTKSVTAAINQRAEKARNKVQDLRRRIGFGDDRRDDLKRLEENAHRAEIFAQQAELDVQVAELQVKMAELEAGDQCAEKRGFY